MNGMETMLRTFLKVAGFNPEQFQGAIRGFIGSTNDKLKDFDGRMVAVEKSLADIAADQKTILSYIKGLSNERNDNGGEYLRIGNGVGDVGGTGARGTGGVFGDDRNGGGRSIFEAAADAIGESVG